MYNSIRPGKKWVDTNGERIQAHGGSMMFVDGKFYWYGENKKDVSANEIWHWGVRLYSSDDLYNWTDEGIILMPEIDDPKSPIHPKSCMDRPHILYNDTTKKFVMWLKIMGENDIQYMVVCQADDIKGPYEIINRKLHPGGMNSGDFDLIKRPDGSAAIVFDRVHTDMIAMELTYDYLDVTVEYSEHYYRKCPPYVREAPAVFFRDGKGYVITSGTTGYFPNPSEVASFDDLHGEWNVLGNPHVGDIKNTSFDSQISCVFKYPYAEDLYIAMADRWLTDLKEDTPNSMEYYAACFDPDCELPKEKIEYYKNLSTDDLTALMIYKADYVWLPIKLENGMPKIYWYDEWKVEDFCK